MMQTIRSIVTNLKQKVLTTPTDEIRHLYRVVGHKITRKRMAIVHSFAPGM